MSVARTLAVALAAGLLSLGAAGAAVTQAASDDTQFFTWFASSGGHDALFTVVYDSVADDTFVLERDGLTGRVRARFGGGFIATGIAATRSGRVYLTASDGTVRVFARRIAGRYRQVARWTLEVPGQTGTAYPTGIVRTTRGYTLVAVTVQGAQPPLTPPAFAGVVVLDSRGSSVASWEVPHESLPENAFVLPATLSRAPRGALFVGGIPCQAISCGGAVSPNGYLYQLSLVTGSRHRVQATTKARWESPELVAAPSVGAIDASHLVIAGGGVGAQAPNAPQLPGGLTLVGPASPLGGDALELRLDGDRIEVAGTLTGTLNPAFVALDVDTSAVSAYLTENQFPSNVNLIERFTAVGTTWTRQGSPWRASWGPSGPPETTCAGRPATIVGSSGPDVLRGSTGPDVIAALGGADVVRGLGGDDLICLGAGDDVAYGGPGQDRILGGVGADQILGRGDEDVLVGGPGADRILGNGGADQLRGGLGDDLIVGRDGPDLMLGHDGRDVLIGGRGLDRALGGSGGDVCLAERSASC